MDGASPLGALRSGRRPGVPDGRPCLSGPEWLTLRRPHLAGEFWHHRKGTAYRDRGAVCFPFRPGPHLLAELVAGAAISVADLDRALGFSRTGLARERAAPPVLFLRGRGRNSLALRGTAETSYACSFRRAHD